LTYKLTVTEGSILLMNAPTKEEVAAFLLKIEEAKANLVARADKTELKAEIDQAAAKTESQDSAYAEMKVALQAAEAVYADDNATQSEADTAAATLKEKLAALPDDGNTDNSGDNSGDTSDNTSDTSVSEKDSDLDVGESEESAESGGCGSSMAASSLCLAMFGAAVISLFGKKERR
jgi:hypothetical protein